MKKNFTLFTLLLLFFLFTFTKVLFAQSTTSGLNSASAIATLAQGSWIWPLTVELTTELHGLMDNVVAEARLRFGSGPAKVVILENSTSLMNDFALKAQNAFPGALVVGVGPGNENYNAFTEDQFAEHGQRSLALLVLGGSDITSIQASGQKPVGQGSIAIQQITAGREIATDLKPFFNSSQKNLIYFLGAGHNPNHKLILCGFKEGVAGISDKCDPQNPESPDLAGLPPLPGYVRIIGSSGYYGANTVIGTNVVAQSALGVLIQGNFQLSLTGLSGSPNSVNIETPISQMNNELNGHPDVLFLIPGHPQSGAYEALRQRMIALLPGTIIFGYEGGGEIGHDQTSAPAVAVINHLFMAGLKSSENSSELLGDINNDRIVNLLDYTILSNAFGTTNSAADLNHDNIVNLLDYTILSNNFGVIG